MKAMVNDSYGSPDVLGLRDLERPQISDDQVLVRVRASSVNALDWHSLTGTPYLMRLQGGLRRPRRRIQGADVAGTVEAVGSGVTDFEPGDEVFGEVSGGGFAEYVAVAPAGLAPKPAGMTHEEAAAVPVAALTALQGLRDHGELAPGQRVLINGASGGVGTFAVQIAKALGAEVTAVCSSRNVDTARTIGADQVIDYTREDFARSGRTFDLMLDLVGNRSLSDCKRVLNRDGIYVMVSGPKGRWLGPVTRMLVALVAFRFTKQRFRWFVAKANQDDLRFLTQLLESGQVRPVIEHRYSLAGAADALRHQGEGHARGKSVITVSADPPAVADRHATAADAKEV